MPESPSPFDQPEAVSRPEKILVFLHDMADTPLTWQDQVGALPEGWRPLTPWLRGMKPIDKEVFDLQAAADALSVIPLEYGVESVALVGEGLGGTVALRCAADSPSMVRGLVLVNPLVAPGGRELRRQRTALRLVPRARLAAQNLDKDRLLAAMDMLATLDLGDATDHVTCPVLILHADDRASRHAAEELASRLPNATFRAVAGGPRPHQDDPQAFNDLVAEFVTSLDDIAADDLPPEFPGDLFDGPTA
ncbi:alpha/beta hydrolase [Raineyella sp. LH-20]|uniref:alpha/beta fold hydrolase n=1 Tax=Raineyella sp. LH-20 TaxID=3081204 RepID=UPI00295330F9|nr:alpha/beta hydrolase [Raineyella sp. LH-20]WOP18778.1 alpha/beta hydrolase [Raineyella sp. LH-20]